MRARIDNSAPTPPPKGRGGRSLIYQFDQLVVDGGCFWMPCDMGRDRFGRDKRQRSIVASAYRWAQRHAPDAVFTTRKIGRKVGCWRTA